MVENRIKEYREALGWSQDKLAKESGIGQSTMTKEKTFIKFRFVYHNTDFLIDKLEHMYYTVHHQAWTKEKGQSM